MLTQKQVFAIVEGITYKHWRIEVIRDTYDPDSPVKVAWVAEVECSKTGKPIILTSAAVRVDHRFDEVMLVKQIRQVLQELVLHELDEHFRYNGVMVFDPHLGEKGYEPERTVRPRSTVIPRYPRHTLAQAAYSSVAVGVGLDERVHDIDPDDYTRFR